MLAIFAYAMAFRSLMAVPCHFLLGARRLRFVTMVMTLEAVFVVMGGAVAVRWKGVAAVALVKLVLSILISVATPVPYTLRQLRIPVSGYMRLSLLPAVLVAGATAATATLTSLWLPMNNWPALLLATILGTAPASAAFFLLSTAENREFLFRKLRTPPG